MWKYQCKKHLLLVLGGMVVGLFLFHDMSTAAITSVMTQMSETVSIDKEVIAMMYSKEMVYFMSVLYGGGLVNAILLLYYALQRFNPWILLLGMMLFGSLFTYVLAIGILGVIPSIIVCIYGMLTIPNRGKHKMFEKSQLTTVSEIERVYRLHHNYIDSYEEMAKKMFLSNIAITLMYALGAAAMIMILLYVEDTMIMIVSFVAYAMLMIGMIRKRNEIVQPVVALLYEECNPEACASVIFALAKKMHSKKNFPLGQYLAQCMIYLNDPNLAIDVLACTRHTNTNTLLPYHSIMAYANYQLGDASEVRRHYEECDKLQIKGMNSPLALIKQQYLESIQNKMDLMDKDFSKSRSFYQNALDTTTMEFQKVDFHYYLGLIAFVEEDVWEAKNQFEYVTAHGNGMYFVEKARKFLSMIEQMQPEES